MTSRAKVLLSVLAAVIVACFAISVPESEAEAGAAVNQTYGLGSIVHPKPDAGATANGTMLLNWFPKDVGCPAYSKAITVTPPTGGTTKCACSDSTASTIRDPTICGSGCDQTQFSANISQVICMCEVDGGPISGGVFPGGLECKVNCGI